MDVADHAGVSRATASLVLRESPLVADATRQRVLKAVDTLGYVYNRGAATLRASRTNTIGLIICDILNPFFTELAVGVDEVLDEEGYIAFLANTSESLDRQTRFLQRMREQNVDGIVLCAVTETKASLIHQLREWQIPCVETLRYASASGSDYVGPDYELGVEQAIGHLAGLGHKRIAYIGGNLPHTATLRRHKAFLFSMEQRGLAADLILKTPVTRAGGAEAMDNLLARSDAPTAALCFNDLVAFGAMRRLERHNLRAGRDFSVIGMDDVPEASLSSPMLTTVSTMPRRIGREAAHLLLHCIKNPQDPPQRIILPPQLIIRESCGPYQAR